MNLKKLITILLVLTFLVQPVLAAEGKAAMGESLKEPALVSKGIENAPADLKGTIKVLDSNVSQYHIKATDNGISIKADLDKKDHTRELTVTRQALEKMKGFDGSRFYAHHFEDDGTYTGYQEVHIGKSQQVTFTVQFSEVLLSSFSGYYEVTQTLSSGQSLTLPAGAERVDVSVGGEVPEYSEIVEDDVSTYWVSPTFLAPMNNATDIAGGAAVTNTNTVFSNSAAIFDGTATLSYNNFFTSNNISIGYSFHRIGAGSAANPGIIAQKTNGFGFVYVPNSGDAVITRIYNTDNTYVQLPSYTIVNGQRYNVTLTINDTSKKILQYVDGAQISETTYTGTLRTGGAGAFLVANQDNEKLNGSVYNVFGYDGYVLNREQVASLHYGFSGIQLANTPYHGGTLTLSPTTEVEYVATDGIAREVTARAFFTEDTTLISDTQTTRYQNVSIVHATGKNTTSGTITYPIHRPYDGTPTLESNNTNATISKDGINFVVSTGPLTTGESFYYNVSVPATPPGTVNPTFAAPAAMFVALAGAFAIARSFINRRRT